jgi:(4-(4-[2-(gamma-L-glutamylamino)ethyl]phenoxymethyl)furan-2-yl)methanamine synthase
MTPPPAILGWDIGGVNTKAARVPSSADAQSTRSISLPYELQRHPSLLGATLQSAASQVGAGPGDRHAVTMTAELSQAFRSKREGVAFILDALEATFPDGRLHVYTVAGRFVSPREARAQPLQVAASNWAATAHWVARLVPTCILIDVGSTTSDLIPIRDGQVAARGRTDPERLLTSELVYTGAVRTPVEAIARGVPLWGGTARLSAEGFALSGDVYLWLGRLHEQDYTCPTPDGRPATREHAGERLARIVCADRDLLDESAVDGMAVALARAQVETIGQALEVIRRRCPEIQTAVVTGLGEFIAADAAQAAGLTVISLTERLNGAPQTAPATAVAWLLRESLETAS